MFFLKFSIFEESRRFASRVPQAMHSEELQQREYDDIVEGLRLQLLRLQSARCGRAMKGANTGNFGDQNPVSVLLS